MAMRPSPARCLLAGLLALGAGTAAQAQVELYQLQIRDLRQEAQVTTTNRGKAEQAGTAPASVIVVTAESIERRGYQSLLDVFQDLPDFKVEYGVDPRWMHDVSIRGIHRMDRFIILLDGIRISSPTNDIIPIMENYPVHLAKQIEIVYGPASALYGADAFAGVINIITKSEGSGLTASILGGRFGTATANLSAMGKLGGKLRYALGGQYHYDRQPEFWQYYPEDFHGLDSLRTGTFNSVFGPIPVPAGISPEPAMEPLKAHALQASVSSKRLRASVFHNYAHLPSTTANSPNNQVYNRGALFGHSVSVGSLVYRAPIGSKVESQTYLTSSYYRLNPQSNFWNVYTGFQKAYLFSLGLMHKAEEIISYTPSERVNLTAGATFEHFYSRPRGHDLNEVPESLHPEGVIIGSRLPLNPAGIRADLPTLVFNNLGFFAQLQWEASPSVSVTVGSRADHNSRFGLTINPRLGIVGKPTGNSVLKFMLGSAYLAPSPLMAYDQFGSFVSFDQGASYQSFFMRLPNPDLQPQKVVSAELSGSYRPNHRVTLTATAFAARLTGLFDYEVNGPTATALHQNQYEGWPVFTVEVSVNQGVQVNYGGNVQVSYQTILSTDASILLYASLSAVSGRVDRDDEGPLPKSEIPAVSPLIAKGGMEYRKGRFTLSPRLLLLDRQRVFSVVQDDPARRQTLPGYLLANLHASYAAGERLRLFVDVQNLFDARYHNVNLGAAPEASGGGAAQAELANGAPQPPLRLRVGARASLF